MEIRPIDFCDEEAYCSFLASFKNDDNPFVAPETTREVTDFKVFVENSRAQERKAAHPDYSTVTTYYTFVDGVALLRELLVVGNLKKEIYRLLVDISAIQPHQNLDDKVL